MAIWPYIFSGFENNYIAIGNQFGCLFIYLLLRRCCACTLLHVHVHVYCFRFHFFRMFRTVKGKKIDMIIVNQRKLFQANSYCIEKCSAQQFRRSPHVVWEKPWIVGCASLLCSHTFFVHFQFQLLWLIHIVTKKRNQTSAVDNRTHLCVVFEENIAKVQCCTKIPHKKVKTVHI